MRMDHERLDVYRYALALVSDVHRFLAALPRGHSDLADQLRRASTSIVLNTAEGAGEFSKREKSRLFRIARRSAIECAATLDVLETLGAASEDATRPLRSQLVRIVSMLVGLIRRGQRSQ